MFSKARHVLAGVWQRSRRVRRFAVAGGTSLSVYYLSLYSLTDGLGMWYIASAIISTVPQHVVNFLLMKLWAFENRNTPLLKQLWPYAKVSAFSFVLNIGLLHTFVEYAGLWYLFAQAVATIIISVVTFLFYRIIFRAKDPVRP